ncbi:hypothetical protein K488DRAFT_67859 [Vararia minispora EC-137]|uniref:Uncharacterized protein n=1 Tax=Vararia minispora EC-137 TaxID=1314806 RepID=A0ACB8QXX1_9AGAM|nr:hypothetical protein K488DRAFT_67859 [Vararia minispora EC-137]
MSWNRSGYSSDYPSWQPSQYHHQQQSQQNQQHPQHQHQRQHQVQHHRLQQQHLSTGTQPHASASSWPTSDFMTLPSSQSILSVASTSHSQSSGYGTTDSGRHTAYTSSPDTSLSHSYPPDDARFGPPASTAPVLYSLPPNFDARSPSSPPVKLEPVDEVRASATGLGFVMEEPLPRGGGSAVMAASDSFPLAGEAQVPLRATQASKEMRGMMSVFRLNPFAIQGGVPEPAPEARPLSAPGEVIQWQLPWTEQVAEHTEERDDAEIDAWTTEVEYGYPLAQAMPAYGDEAYRQAHSRAGGAFDVPASMPPRGDYRALQQQQTHPSQRYGPWEPRFRAHTSSSTGSRSTTAGTYSDVFEDQDEFFRTAAGAPQHANTLRRLDEHGHGGGYYS